MIEIDSGEPVFYDTESVGLHGMPVLLQYAQGNGPINLVSLWLQPISETLRLIESMMLNQGGVVGFNLAFDQLMLCKAYTVFSAHHDHGAEPIEIVDELAELEMAARDGPCVKPRAACDLFLVARRGKYQSTMDRGDIRIRRVPTALAWQLAEELEQRVKLKDIYFARRKDKRAAKWVVYDTKDADGESDPDFKDIVLKFAPSSALKALAVDALGIKEDALLLFGDAGVDEAWYPEEYGYAPFAKAAGGNRHNWRGAWPEKVRHHVSHWAYHERARRYAADDVRYTRDLWKHFGCPAPGDDDSELACAVAAVRWRGFRIDLPRLRELRASAIERAGKIPTAPGPVRYYINEVLDQTVRVVLRGSTKKTMLEEIAGWRVPCLHCNAGVQPDYVVSEGDMDSILDGGDGVRIKTEIPASPGCDRCERGSIKDLAAIRAQEVLDARAADKEVELYDKLLLAGRFHASFKVIGALSGRMAGADGLNPQGIKKTTEVRSCFPLAWDGMVLCGGDFSGFEVTIAEAVYNDANLRKMLLTCERCGGEAAFVLERNDIICAACGSNKQKKIHALFGLHCYPEHTYESLKATDGTANDLYKRAKSGVFALMYGGTEHTLADRLGVPVEIGVKALASFHREFPGVRRFQTDIFESHCTMRQPGGIGTRVEWHEPADYRETMLGFRRYFTLENSICRALYTLANKPPRSWQSVQIRVQRRERTQTAGGAVQSALYGAAFQIQAGCMRAAANHDIQSTGATMTKVVQRKIWDLQPCGVGPWLVQPMNIHDEIMAPTVPHMCAAVKQAVVAAVEGFREKIPLVKMDWITGLKSWAEKG